MGMLCISDLADDMISHNVANEPESKMTLGFENTYFFRFQKHDFLRFLNCVSKTRKTSLAKV